MLPDIFCKAVSREVINRIEKLDSHTQPIWGKMNVAQMLAHCCVSYEYVYENKYKPPGFLMKLILKNMVKNTVVNETAYKRNNRTAPDFLITDERDFQIEKERLIAYIEKTQELGKSYFKDRESHSFGKLSCTEWNNMFYKHLDHHLTQFGV
ncbi:DUF1569 domain-containing protein [Dyadobacter sp. LHD-138]|uniref:DUF1569 domain-containing protein n=1 Tax=Dyadobacter sp. LHD-138 TaxID=3071413 RepID=UPI0027E1FC06|nr:DUF1569 domain-containing protein [Dyadobacter sp. LHD-138]MDQ6479561.1 DUF1569 domain-containing protein [Dyadobacter sp. LHD-138]